MTSTAPVPAPRRGQTSRRPGTFRRAAAAAMTAAALALGMVTGIAAEPARAVAATALTVPPARTETSARTSPSLATEVRVRKVDGT
jgi:hypothetical protein